MVWTERSSLAVDLWRYGEDELWKRVLTLPDRTMKQIGERADYHLTRGPTTRAGDSMLISKALALAAIEVLEGHSRPLKRTRRRPTSQFPGATSSPELDRDALARSSRHASAQDRSN